MTSTNKAQEEETGSMETETKDIKALPVVTLEPANERISIPDRLFSKLRKETNKLTVRTWVNVAGQETAIEEKRVKLGALDVDVGGNRYAIDYASVQNIFGELVYNTTHRVANGALRFVSQSSKDVDAKIRKHMSARDNLTAIWSRWQLPFIACIIAMLVAIVAIAVLAVVLAQKQSVDACMQNERCLADRILQLQIQAQQAQARTNQ